MSIKNVITNNGIASASFNGKNYSRREVNGVVFYDISGGGGANVTTDPNAPTGGSDGDLWYDETNGSLYVYTDSINGWIQTNGGSSGGGGSSTGDVTPANPADGDLWFNTADSKLYAYSDAQSAWLATNGGAPTPRAWGRINGAFQAIDSYNVSSVTFTVNNTNADKIYIYFQNPITNVQGGFVGGNTGGVGNNYMETSSSYALITFNPLYWGQNLYFQVF